MKLMRLVVVVSLLSIALFAQSPTDAPLRYNGQLHCVSPLSCTTLGSVTTIDATLVGSAATGTGFLHFVSGVADAAAKTVDLASGDVTGILVGTKGGTDNGFFAVTGPTTATRTFTFPDVSSTVLTSNAAVTVAQGGTGIASGTSGGVPYFSSTTAISSSALLTANALVLGGGAGTMPATNTAFTTNGTTELDIGVAGGGNGVLGLKGNTSGTATFTAPATAGTVTNGITVSNVLLAAQGTAALPTYSFAAFPTIGLYANTNVGPVLTNNADLGGFNSGGLLLLSNGGITWQNHNSPLSGSGSDTALARAAAGVVQVGTAIANASGSIKTNQTLQVITSNFTTASATLVTITGLSWTAPVSYASNWSFECNLLYSQATGAAANLWGVQTATTAATNLAAAGDIFTSNAGAHTQGSVTAISSTTAQTVVTATPGATATVYQGRIWGTIEAPSNASPTVLNIQVATGNVSDTITVYRGSQCQVW